MYFLHVFFIICPVLPSTPPRTPLTSSRLSPHHSIIVSFFFFVILCIQSLLPTGMLTVLLALSRVDLVHIPTVAESSWIEWPRHGIAQDSSLPSSSYTLSLCPPLLSWSPELTSEPVCVRIGSAVSFMTWVLTVILITLVMSLCVNCCPLQEEASEVHGCKHAIQKVAWHHVR